MRHARSNAVIAFSGCNELNETLVALASERLTQKQKAIIVYIEAHAEPLNVTRLAAALSKHFDCSLSAVWNNLRSLKSARIISYSSKDNKGLPVQILSHAQVISEKIREEDGKWKRL
ncbi:hypothetical protein HYV85_01040 [Candidatus Woesearchaeota archaeon]|nr:hypothetical protein [Candidatus Woesearchaeota archaeon]